MERGPNDNQEPILQNACTIGTDEQGRVPVETVARLWRAGLLKHSHMVALGWFGTCKTVDCDATIFIWRGTYEIWLPDSCPLMRLANVNLPTQRPMSD